MSQHNLKLKLLKVYRDAKADDRVVDRQVSQLLKFIQSRSRSTNVMYVILSYAEKGCYGTYIFLASDDEHKLEAETEIIKSFVDSHLDALEIKDVKAYKARTLIPMPKESRFFRRPARELMLLSHTFMAIKYIYPRTDTEPDLHAQGPLLPLGYIIKGSYNKVVGLSIRSILMHVLIVGATGSGKSNTVATLIDNSREILEKLGLKVIIIDWHGEYSHLINEPFNYIKPSDLTLNPFASTKDLDAVIDIFEEVFELTGPQSYLLYKIIEDHRVSSIRDLIEFIESAPEESHWFREVKYALLRKLSLMVRGSSYHLFKNDNINRLFSKTDSIYLIDTSLIRNATVRKLYVTLLLKELFDRMVYGGKGNERIILVIEEAQNIFSKESRSSFLRKFINEIRKFGISLILVTQSPSRILDEALTNTAVKIIHAIRSNQDLDIIMRITSLPEEYSRLLPVLDSGEAILYSPDYKIPLLIKVSKVTV